MRSCRRLLRLFALVLMAACIVTASLWFYRLHEHLREFRAGRELVERLPQRRPADVDPKTWECATNWAITAYGNVTSIPGHVPLEEMRRLNADLEERLRGTVDLATVDWVWVRLGDTGPSGQGYRERFEPQYRENMMALKERR